MAKFTKKPLMVEARLHDGSYESAMAMCNWIGVGYARWYCAGNPMYFEVYIETFEGRMTASPGDWIIRGVKGEFYPCKPDVFEMTYEPEALSHAAGQEAVNWKADIYEALAAIARIGSPGELYNLGAIDRERVMKQVDRIRRATDSAPTQASTNPAEIGRKSVGGGQGADRREAQAAGQEMAAIHARLLTEADNLLSYAIKRSNLVTPAQPPASAEVGRDAVGANFYAACERACSELPPGWEIRVCLEKDSGTVELGSPDGFSEYMDVDADDRLTAELNAAIDAAMAASSGRNGGEE